MLHYICPECEKQDMRMATAFWIASEEDAEWTFTCNSCGWSGTRAAGFWDQDGRWNRRSGSLNW
ncbi:hypothetical protein [Microbacterium aerolatum]|uniref:hypothetical protein n=1 Tax=Microbacterium aerolatum TaxID=153731 RepID=UPI0020019077|nr:hypothetical protein [Microbacterium aerolatum]